MINSSQTPLASQDGRHDVAAFAVRDGGCRHDGAVDCGLLEWRWRRAAWMRLEMAVLALFVITMPWMVIGFWNALISF